MIVKGHTKSGIKFSIDSRIKDDVRLVALMTMAQNEEEPSKKNKNMMDLLALIFGSNDNVLDFMNAVAGAHKGVCTPEYLLLELKQMLEAINAKNC